MRISDICKERQLELKLSNSAIAELSEVSINTVNNFFSKRSISPSIYTVGPICKVLGVSLDAIFGIVDPAMDAAEAERVQEESEKYRMSMEKNLQEADAARLDSQHTIELQAKQLGHQEEIIARQDDRIKYQKKAITIHRIAIVALLILLVVKH